jgi:hypothetical protein
MAAASGPERLIIVTGVRRSGTTLVNHVLCHSNGQKTLAEAQPLTQLLDAFDWCEGNYERMTADFFRGVPDYLGFRAEVCRRFVERTWQTLGEPATLVLKNPELALHADRLAAMFPACRIVACVRDPRDQVASELEVQDRRRAAQGAGRGHERGAAAFADEYLRYLEPLLELADAEPARVHWLRYEDLVGWTPATLAGLAAFTGIDVGRYQPDQAWAVPEAYLARLAQRPSASSAYGKSISRERIGAYRDRLAPDEIAVVERITEGPCRRFDYS